MRTSINYFVFIAATGSRILRNTAHMKIQRGLNFFPPHKTYEYWYPEVPWFFENVVGLARTGTFQKKLQWRNEGMQGTCILRLINLPLLHSIIQAFSIKKTA
jgi:hypothetical protein